MKLKVQENEKPAKTIINDAIVLHFITNKLELKQTTRSLS